MRVNWCSGCGGGHNFGDQLTPALLRLFGISATWAPPAQAQLVVVGSILSKLPNGWRGRVLGTGLIRPGIGRDLRRARVLAVRGALTRDACSLGRDTALGDPGILAPDLVPAPTPAGAGYELVVPHYVDGAIAGRHPGARAAAITWGPAQLVPAVAGASLVYTSSLHALILADALGVPQVLELGATTGGLHKFTDYASAYGEVIVPGVPHLTDRAAMAERQAALRRLFVALTG